MRGHVLINTFLTKRHVQRKRGVKKGKIVYTCVSLQVGGEDLMKMRCMHYLSVSGISCFMDLFKSSQVKRRRRGKAEVRDMQKSEASTTFKCAASFILPFLVFLVFYE